MVGILGKYHTHRGDISEAYRIRLAEEGVDQLLLESTQSIAVGQGWTFGYKQGHGPS